MTLLERVEHRQANIDDRLIEAFRDLPDAFGLAITSSLSGTHALLVIDERGGRFFDTEDAATERLVEIRRQYPDAALDLLCVSLADASGMDLPADARVFRFDGLRD